MTGSQGQLQCPAQLWVSKGSNILVILVFSVTMPTGTSTARLITGLHEIVHTYVYMCVYVTGYLEEWASG